MVTFVIANNPSIINLANDADVIGAATTYDYVQTNANPPQYSTRATRLFTQETTPLVQQALDFAQLPTLIAPWFKATAPSNMLMASCIARSLVPASIGTPYTATSAGSALPLERLVLQITFYVIDARIHENTLITQANRTAIRRALIGADTLPATRETQIDTALFRAILASRAAIATNNTETPPVVEAASDTLSAATSYTAIATISSFLSGLNLSADVTSALQNQDVADCFRFFNLIRRLENVRSNLANQSPPPLALIRIYMAAQYTVIYYLLSATLQNYVQATANAATLATVYPSIATNEDLVPDVRSLVKTLIGINVALKQDSVTIQTLRTRIANFRATVNQQATLNEQNNTRYALETSKSTVLGEKQARIQESYGMSRTTLIGLLVLLIFYIGGMLFLFQLPVFQIPGSSPVQYQPQFLKGVMIANGLVALAIVLYDMIVLLVGREAPKA